MAHRIQLSLTDDLMEFVKQQCGDGTLYVTPQEYRGNLRELLRQHRECRGR